MNALIKTIPELLVTTRGNQTKVGEILGISRHTVREYARDFEAKKHIVINGVLMVAQGNRGIRSKGGEIENNTLRA